MEPIDRRQFLAVTAAATAGCVAPQGGTPVPSAPATAPFLRLHEVRNFDHLLGTLRGFSDAQLRAHFTLYRAAAAKWNEIEEKLPRADRSAASPYFGEYSELKRREAAAWNSTVLHEAYFENMAGDPGEPEAALKVAIEESFGSFKDWEADLRAAAASTPGWVLLARSNPDGRLRHCVLPDHGSGVPVMQSLLVALDCYEHSYFLDYGVRKGEYLDAFLKNLNWKAVNGRFAGLAKSA